MIELVMFILIVSVAVAGVLQVLNFTEKRSGDPQLRKQALSIAEGLLEEIELARFTFCDPADANADTATSPAGCASVIENVGPEAGNSRPFDNVNDYVAAFATPQAYSTDANGNAIAVTGPFTATVTITPSVLNGISADVAPYTNPAVRNALLIRVAVSYNNGNDTVTLDGYRTRYAPREMP